MGGLGDPPYWKPSLRSCMSRPAGESIGIACRFIWMQTLNSESACLLRTAVPPTSHGSDQDKNLKRASRVLPPLSKHKL
jgi:hypothetical protein